MRKSPIANERGIALAVAIFALVVIGALVAGTFYAGRLEQQTGENTFYANQAGEAAQAALTQTVQSQMGGDLLSIPMGATPSFPTVSVGSGLSATSSIRRLTSSLWLAQAVGTRTDAGGHLLATRTLEQLVRLNQPEMAVNAGLTAIGKISISGNSTVSGYDMIPADWGGVDCPPLDSVAGVYYHGQVNAQGSSTIRGTPNRVQDTLLTSANMLGGTNFNDLKALASLILTGNVSGLAPATTGNPPVCNKTVENNWGAPTDKTSPCFTYFPIIYHYGDLSIQGNGAGQGILLVEGNLSVQGSIDFYGPVIATGAVKILGTGADDVKFYGGVIAQDVTLDDSKLSGNAMINYSSCAITRALQYSALPMAVRERGWVQVY